MTPFVLQEQGDWFEAEIHFVRKYLQPGMGVIDVGANYGVYTCASAIAVGPRGRVWSFEPGTLPHGCLAQSINDNGWSQVILHKTALSNRLGTARLGISPNAELNSLSQDNGMGEDVPLSTLDAELEGFDRSIDFMKLDAEGEEIRILSAAADFFSRHDPLIMFEYKHGTLVNTGLIDAVRAFGMEVYRLVPGLNCLMPHANDPAADTFLLNLFACRPSKVAQLIERGLIVDPSALAHEPNSAVDPELVVGEWLKNRPWAHVMWPAGLPRNHTNGYADYLAGLADLILAEDSARPVVERFTRLKRAEDTLRRVLALRATVPRGFALARVQADLGLRGASLQTLQDINQIFAKRKGFSGYRPDEILVPADRRHDELAPQGGDAGLLVQAMFEEPFLERCAFSIYFCWPQIVPLLRRISENPLTTESMRRRLGAANQWLTAS